MLQGLWGRAVLAGLVASAVMAMWQMIVEAIGGQGLFAPPVYIGATVLRNLQDVQGAPGLGPIEPLGIILGMMGHMMNSVVLAVVFAAVAPRIGRSLPGLTALGAVWGILVFGAMYLIITPVIDPAFARLNPVALFAGHMMWGAVIGAVLAWKPAPQLRRAPAHS